MRKTFLTLLSVVAMTMSAQYKSQVWSPDNGDGTFTNPVINADYSGRMSVWEPVARIFI